MQVFGSEMAAGLLRASSEPRFMFIAHFVDSIYGNKQLQGEETDMLMGLKLYQVQPNVCQKVF